MKKYIYHKTNGPAWIGARLQEWVYHGQWHRYYGPAKIWSWGREDWYLRHKKIK